MIKLNSKEVEELYNECNDSSYVSFYVCKKKKYILTNYDLLP